MESVSQGVIVTVDEPWFGRSVAFYPADRARVLGFVMGQKGAEAVVAVTHSLELPRGRIVSIGVDQLQVVDGLFGASV